MTAKSGIGAWSPEGYAQHLSVSRATVYSWLQKGWLNSIKIGGCRRILSEHDAAFIERFEETSSLSVEENID